MNPTPEQLAEMWAWYEARKQQFIAFPLDPASRAVIAPDIPITDSGAGSTPLTQVVGTAGPNATVPAAYAGSERFVLPDGTVREFGYIA